MNLDAIPIVAVFVGMILLVMASTEGGYRLGHRSHQRSEEEKESPVSAIAGSILGLLAFILAFTFGIVTERYDVRKGLVREEANTIRTTYLRSDFLPDPDRAEARGLLRDYVTDRLAANDLLQAGKLTEEETGKIMAKVARIHSRLWEMAVANARKDMNSDVAALYIDSLNGVIELHATRVAVALQARIPSGIWITLLSLTFFGMVSVGYQIGIAGSRRSLVQPILAISFSMVIALIVSLDRPQSGYVTVSQQPLRTLRDSMGADSGGVKPP